jgi:hypothetical protein
MANESASNPDGSQSTFEQQSEEGYVKTAAYNYSKSQ